MEKQEEASKIPTATNCPGRSQTKDDVTNQDLENRPGRIVNRSVSLKRTEESLERKRRRSPSPKIKKSPKKKVSVLERRRAIESKYRMQLNKRGKKEKATKETAKERKEKAR